MIGTNVLMLNKGTVMKAIEHYLNDVQFKEPVKVNTVSEKAADHTFEVTIAPIEDEKGE